jgi:hypothetical protein
MPDVKRPVLEEDRQISAACIKKVRRDIDAYLE